MKKNHKYTLSNKSRKLRFSVCGTIIYETSNHGTVSFLSLINTNNASRFILMIIVAKFFFSQMEFVFAHANVVFVFTTCTEMLLVVLPPTFDEKAWKKEFL